MGRISEEKESITIDKAELSKEFVEVTVPVRLWEVSLISICLTILHCPKQLAHKTTNEPSNL